MPGRRATLLQGTLDLLILKALSEAKYYTLTRTGRRQLGEEAAQWNQIALAIARALES